MEAVQSRGSTISGGRDDIPDWTFRRAGTAGRPSRPTPGDHEPLRRDGGPARPLDEVLDDVVDAVHRSTGRPVVAVDLTPRTDPWPPTVQVLAPGLGLALEHPRPQSLTSRSFV